MKRLLFLFACLALCGASMVAQTTQQRDYVTITFTPDHADWNYQLGEKVVLRVSVRRFNIDLPNQEITYKWGPEMRTEEFKETISTGENGHVELNLSGSSVPGFKTCYASTTVDGKEYSNYITLGFNVQDILPTTTMPEDFMAFWEANMKAARKSNLAPLLILQPELCTPYSDVYMIRFSQYWEENHMYGILRVPKGDGPFPALLEVPGAGVRSYKGCADDYAKAGIVSLQIGIHGIPVNLPDYVYQDLKTTALAHYNTHCVDNRENYYYKRVYTGCVRAVDFLCSLPYVDSTRIGVFGGSQGGALSLIVAGLDKRITCCSAAYPALCEMAGSQYGRIDGWPRLFTGKSNSENREQKIAVTRYYDVVNFARLITAPVLFIQGYNDRVCPPTTTHAAYNVITASKQSLYPLDCAHWLYGNEWYYRRDWLIEHLTH